MTRFEHLKKRRCPYAWLDQHVGSHLSNKCQAMRQRMDDKACHSISINREEFKRLEHTTIGGNIHSFLIGEKKEKCSQES